MELSLADMRRDLVARAISIEQLNSELVDLTNDWLVTLWQQLDLGSNQLALIALGGLGRGELTAGSDLDLLLLHQPKHGGIAATAAEKIWYPIWDAGIGLDHSVRTIEQSLALAKEDIRVIFGLLDMRLIAGNQELFEEFKSTIFSYWRAHFLKRLEEIIESDRSRHLTFGDLAHLQNPNLKESQGGLRDLVTLNAMAKSWQIEVGHSKSAEAKRVLLEARSALHLLSGKATDLLAQDLQLEVAQRLGFETQDEFLKNLYRAARTINYQYLVAIKNAQYLKKTGSRFSWKSKPKWPVGDGVIVADDQIQLAQSQTWDDSILLRVAAAAAKSNLLISSATLDWLAANLDQVQWKVTNRDMFVELLAAGSGLIQTWEQLDQVGVISKLVPEWDVVRCAPQHNSIHTYTVDRHLIQTVVEASEIVTAVSRPDILLVAAWLHDIGKARLGDHSIVGAQLAKTILSRMGFAEADCLLIEFLVRQHLLLPEVATKRDIEDPAVITQVADLVKSTEVLDLLHQLALADARATSTTAASNWRLALINQLVIKVKSVLAGEEVKPEPELLDDLPLDESGFGFTVSNLDSGYLVKISSPDQAGLLANVAGLFALQRLQVRSAKTKTIAKRAVSQWVVTPMYGDLPAFDLLRSEMYRAIKGNIDVSAQLASRDQSAFPKPISKPRVIFAAESKTHTILEVRTPDGPAVLHRIAKVISDQGFDILAAHVATLGAVVDDVFYIQTASGTQLDGPQQQDLSQAILSELSS